MKRKRKIRNRSEPFDGAARCSGVPRYFFHLRGFDGLDVEDFEGTDRPDLDRARAEAVRDARILIGQQIGKDGTVLRGWFAICDKAGKVLAVVPLRNTLTF
ncbi:hypothetical protein JMJ55_16625 [Belnapia sp. T6]|uniref:DUF6894 domain-containing protein n=1 Tax=Belnapia mucosa TaxID=2804532 RepID=A0ABS1V896_9PROT|nr:hypothetical protein [Belnapia mucosa]MBL6456964.1 hypothetical protein [Belnapia mucosa]